MRQEAHCRIGKVTLKKLPPVPHPMDNFMRVGQRLAREAMERAKVINPIVLTGARRRRWFRIEVEVEGPVCSHKACNPVNYDRWPRGKWWVDKRKADKFFGKA